MEINEIAKLITEYISIWFWFTLSMGFFMSSLIVFAVTENLSGNNKSIIIFLTFFALFIVTQMFVIRRIWKFQNE